jgi:hypothetical protein
MMNWTTQFEDMMKAWTDTQKKAWDSYFDTMQGLNKSQGTRMWESTLTMGEEMLKDMLKTQMQGLSAWVDGLAKMEGVPAQMVESARQFQEMSARWNKTQSELIENWFGMLKKFAPASPTEAWTEMPQTMFKTWQDTTQSVMDAQTNWMRSWMEQTRKSNDE